MSTTEEVDGSVHRGGRNRPKSLSLVEEEEEDDDDIYATV
jgi:hypothetical protein